MGFRRRWFGKYGGRHPELRERSLKEAIEWLDLQEKKKGELEDLVETLFQGAFLMNKQIDYLEELALHENEQNRAAKSKIKNLLVAFILIVIFGLFPLAMHLLS